MGAEAEVRRERKGAGWAEEGRRGVGGLVERGSGAVWRYAGCLCGLSRGLIRYDSPGHRGGTVRAVARRVLALRVGPGGEGGRPPLHLAAGGGLGGAALKKQLHVLVFWLFYSLW